MYTFDSLCLTLHALDFFFLQVNQILEMNDADEEDWAELLKYNVLAIFPLEDWALLPMRGQLALASTIVGAKSLVHYDIAFRIMW